MGDQCAGCDLHTFGKFSLHKLLGFAFWNVFACLAKDVREGTGPVCFGVSTETNHRSVMIVRLAMVAAAGQLKISNNVRSDAWPQ